METAETSAKELAEIRQVRTSAIVAFLLLLADSIGYLVCPEGPEICSNLKVALVFCWFDFLGVALFSLAILAWLSMPKKWQKITGTIVICICLVPIVFLAGIIVIAYFFFFSLFCP